MATTMRPLTAKQARFVEEYPKDCDGPEAYRRAGYRAKSNETARVGAIRLLTNPTVSAAIRDTLAQRSKECKIEAADVLKELGLLAFSDIGQVLDFSRTEPHLKPACDITEAARRAISSVKVKRHLEGKVEDAREVEVVEFKLWDKLTALDKLCKHLGILKETLDITLHTPFKVYGFDPHNPTPEDATPSPGK